MTLEIGVILCGSAGSLLLIDKITQVAITASKSEARRKLKDLIREYEDGLVTKGYGYTMADTVRDWLAFGLSGRDDRTITKCTILANTHIILALGARKLATSRRMTLTNGWPIRPRSSAPARFAKSGPS